MAPTVVPSVANATCSACDLALPGHLVFKCDGHCDAVLCISCLKSHAKEVSMTYRNIPAMMRGKKK